MELGEGVKSPETECRALGGVMEHGDGVYSL